MVVLSAFFLLKLSPWRALRSNQRTENGKVAQAQAASHRVVVVVAKAIKQPSVASLAINTAVYSDIARLSFHRASYTTELRVEESVLFQRTGSSDFQLLIT